MTGRLRRVLFVATTGALIVTGVLGVTALPRVLSGRAYERVAGRLAATGFGSVVIAGSERPPAVEGEPRSIGYATLVIERGGTLQALDEGIVQVMLGNARVWLLAPGHEDAAGAQLTRNIEPALPEAIRAAADRLGAPRDASWPSFRLHLLAFGAPVLSRSSYQSLSRRQRAAYDQLSVLRGLMLVWTGDVALVDAPGAVALLGPGTNRPDGCTSTAMVWSRNLDLSHMVMATAPSADEARIAMLRVLGSLRYLDVSWESNEELAAIIRKAVGR